jgi:Transposase DDE domain
VVAAPKEEQKPEEERVNLTVFEHDRPFVIEALRRGEVDYLENISEAAEADLFRHLIDRRVLERLAESYPRPREKEEVPVWFYLASQISLRLHGAPGYHAFPYVIRSGGLIDALGPEVGRKAVHPRTGDVTLSCPGFNDKNRYDRQTPCDQDFLRKFARDTDAPRLHAWFNREVPRGLRALKLFDPEGLFIGDASYLFVPDQEHYEQSAVLLFDEHHHPVDPKAVDRRDKRYQWHRCYKIVSLIHVNRHLDFFLVVAARLVPGNQHECPLLYELVDGFVKAVGTGVMKVLILERGLLDGPALGRLKTQHHIDTVIPLKSNMHAYQDVLGLTRLKDFRWEPFVLPPATPPEPPDRPQDPVLAQRERKRRRKLQARQARSHPHPLPPARTLLGIVRGVSSWKDCPVPLTAVINREINPQGEVHDWVLTTTAPHWSAQLTRLTYKLRTAIEERHRQYKCFWDITRLTACQFSLVLSQVLFVLLAYTLLQGHLFLRHRAEMNRRTRSRILERLGPTVQVVAVYYHQRFGLLLLPEFAEILLELVEDARGKLLKKMRLLKRDLYQLLENARSP